VATTETAKAPFKMILCMPQFSLTGLMILRCRRRAITAVVYGKLPLYLRAPIKIFQRGEGALMRCFSILSGYYITKILHENGVPNYPALNMRAMAAAVPATLNLEKELCRSRWTLLAGDLIGQDEARALALQVVADKWIWPIFREITVSAASASPPGHLEVMLASNWPADWNEALRGAMPEIAITWFLWPRWYASFRRFGLACSVFVSTLFWALLAGIRRGGRATPRNRSKVRLMAEFIDCGHLNGTPLDIDYLVDGKTLLPQDFLLFVTREQAKKIAASGVQRTAVNAQIADKGYKIIWIDELPLQMGDLKKLAFSCVRALRCFADSSPSASVFQAAGAGLMRFAPLLRHVRAEACIYYKIPYGDAAWRQDSAVLTGLCRKQGIISAGCQTRVIYGPLYEHAFDCYDLHLCWGPAWFRPLRPALRYVKQTVYVGCSVLDLLLPMIAAKPSKRVGTQRDVLIFTGDVAGSHYTFDYNISFLKACLSLAGLYPNDSFLVKTKDPEHAGRFLSERALAEVIRHRPNFSFIKRARHDYAELLVSADIVIAIGFTTPGTEALLLGKPAIYYSELYWGGEAFQANSLWVARNAKELEASFEACGSCAVDFSKNLDDLDAYRDGQARSRILKALLRS
jgi:hypothetical protein